MLRIEVVRFKPRMMLRVLSWKRSEKDPLIEKSVGDKKYGWCECGIYVFSTLKLGRDWIVWLTIGGCPNSLKTV